MSAEEILCSILDCGALDISVLTRIDRDILDKGIDNLAELNKEESLSINFPNLYVACARVAISECGGNPDNHSIDGNYIASRVYIRDEELAEKVENLGFTVERGITEEDDEEEED